MPSSIAHASVAVLLTPMLGRTPISRRALGSVAVAAAVPDVDAIGRPFGGSDVALLGGHRGDTHSVWFALIVGVVAFAFAKHAGVRFNPARFATYAALVVLSHGLLDALSTYGEGVAFFAPLSVVRWKAAWQPFSGLLSEIVILWLPALVLFQRWTKNWLIQDSPSRGTT